MLRIAPALGFRFDISAVNDSCYGLACWKIFWRAVVGIDLRGVFLFHGDTSFTNQGSENVYCLALQTGYTDVLDAVKSAMTASAEFRAVSAHPMFIRDDACTSEPLAKAGNFDNQGNLLGEGDAKWAREAVHREREAESAMSTPAIVLPDQRLVYTCVQCKTSFRLKAELAGKRVKCPKCNEEGRAPAGAEEPTAVTATTGIDFVCSHCSYRCVVKAELAGKVGKCPKCKQKSRVDNQSVARTPAATPTIVAKPKSQDPSTRIPKPSTIYVYRWGVEPTKQDVDTMIKCWLELWSSPFTLEEINGVRIIANDGPAFPSFPEFASDCVREARAKHPKAVLDDRLAFGIVQDLVLIVVWDDSAAAGLSDLLANARKTQEVNKLTAAQNRIDTSERDTFCEFLCQLMNNNKMKQASGLMDFCAFVRQLMLSPTSLQQKVQALKAWWGGRSSVNLGKEEIFHETKWVFNDIHEKVKQYLRTGMIVNQPSSMQSSRGKPNSRTKNESAEQQDVIPKSGADHSSVPTRKSETEPTHDPDVCAGCGKAIGEMPELMYAWMCPTCKNSLCRSCGGGGERVGGTSLVAIDPASMHCPVCAESSPSNVKSLQENVQKQPCNRCGKKILPSTAGRTGGMCMPCFQRGETSERNKALDSDWVQHVPFWIVFLLMVGAAIFLTPGHFDDSNSRVSPNVKHIILGLLQVALLAIGMGFAGYSVLKFRRATKHGTKPQKSEQVAAKASQDAKPSSPKETGQVQITRLDFDEPTENIRISIGAIKIEQRLTDVFKAKPSLLLMRLDFQLAEKHSIRLNSADRVMFQAFLDKIIPSD